MCACAPAWPCGKHPTCGSVKASHLWVCGRHSSCRPVGSVPSPASTSLLIPIKIDLQPHTEQQLYSGLTMNMASGSTQHLAVFLLPWPLPATLLRSHTCSQPRPPPPPPHPLPPPPPPPAALQAPLLSPLTLPLLLHCRPLCCCWLCS